MRRAWVAVLLGLGAGILPLLACRAIIGIEDLERVDGSTSEEASVDSGSPGPADAAADADANAVGVDAALANMCRSQSDCRRCCKQNSGNVIQDFEQNNSACLCTAECKAECQNKATCLDPPGEAGAEPGDCRVCLDDNLRDGLCADKCTTPACRAALLCMQTCN